MSVHVHNKFSGHFTLITLICQVCCCAQYSSVFRVMQVNDSCFTLQHVSAALWATHALGHHMNCERTFVITQVCLRFRSHCSVMQIVVVSMCMCNTECRNVCGIVCLLRCVLQVSTVSGLCWWCYYYLTSNITLYIHIYLCLQIC